MTPSPALRSRLREVAALDPRSLALFRVGLGLLLLANLAGRASHFTALYADGGVLPREVVDRVAPGWAHLYFAYLVDGSDAAVIGVALLSAAFAVLLVLGLFTRLATFASWFLLVCLNTRNMLATSYEDFVLTLLLFFAIFLPLGRRFSLDARRRGGPRSNAPVVSGASFALIVQFACIYFFSALLKSGHSWHSDGNAVFYALSQNYVARPTAALALQHREILGFLTHLTRLWELLVGFAMLSPVWNGPLRSLAVLTVWTFHAGLGVFLTLFLFPWVMGVGGLALLPAWAWEHLPRRAARPADTPAHPAPSPPAATATRRTPSLLAWLGHSIPLAALAYALAANLASLWPGAELPAALRAVGATLRLDQRWAMYGPDPEPWDYYYVVPGTLADGRRADLLRGGAALTPSPPPLPWRGPSRAWGLYLDHARVNRHKGPGLGLASWYCRSWNAAHTGAEHLVRLEWLQVRFDLRRERLRQQRQLGAWTCPATPAGLTRPAD